jgi:hypothetical protein
VDNDFVAHGSEFGHFSGRVSQANDGSDSNLTAADGYLHAVFHGLEQLGQIVPGIGDADFQVHETAIWDGYVKICQSWRNREKGHRLLPVPFPSRSRS